MLLVLHSLAVVNRLLTATQGIVEELLLVLFVGLNEVQQGEAVLVGLSGTVVLLEKILSIMPYEGEGLVMFKALPFQLVHDFPGVDHHIF